MAIKAELKDQSSRFALVADGDVRAPRDTPYASR